MQKKLMGEIKGAARPRTHWLAPQEDKLIELLYPLVPQKIETYHLTLSSILSSALMIISGLLARQNQLWLLGISAALFIHYITDMLDGEVGRRRQTGLVKWGFYADHFLDLFFAASMFVAYAIFMPQLSLASFIFFAVIALFFLDSTLKALTLFCYSTSGFAGCIGPTELSLLWLIINTSFAFSSQAWMVNIFYLSVTASSFGLIAQFVKRSKQLWLEDIEVKQKKSQNQ